MGGGGNPANTKTMIRYAPYIESKHQSFLNMVADSRISLIGSSGKQALTYDEWMAENHPEVAKGSYVEDGTYGDNIYLKP